MFCYVLLRALDYSKYTLLNLACRIRNTEEANQINSIPRSLEINLAMIWHNPDRKILFKYLFGKLIVSAKMLAIRLIYV